MSKKIGNTFEDLLTELNKDPEFREEYRLLDLRHELLKKIYDRRKELGWTQAKLAQEAGTHQANVSRIESGELNVRIDTISELAEAMGTQVELRLVPYLDDDEVEYKPLVTVKANNKPRYERVTMAPSKSMVRV